MKAFTPTLTLKFHVNGVQVRALNRVLTIAAGNLLLAAYLRFSHAS